MGSFLFKWDHPASEVFVTGTFDDWAKSVKLDKIGEGFQKLVELPQVEEKIYYKFVVDGNWTTDHTAPKEEDGASNVNNVLIPQHITKPKSSSHEPIAGIMSGVTAQSTTAGLAGNVPKEQSRAESGSRDLPGTFPETSANELSEYSVNPIPATSGMGNPVSLAAGEKVPNPSTITSNTISSTVHDDPSLSKNPEDPEQAFGIAPLPATAGIGNPISLHPGEKVPDPSTFTKNTINSTATTDRGSYENSSGVPQLPNVVTPQNEREEKGGMFNIPGLTQNMIPESSLPMGGSVPSERDPGYTIQSAGAQSTTAALAGNVPLEPRGVPEVVRESQEEAGFAPEASASRDAVREKTEMEHELGSKVPEAPPIHERAIRSVGAESTTAALAGEVPKETRGVPEVVRESQQEAGFAPEASANQEAVREKTEMEKELESKVPEEPPIHEATIQSVGAQSTTAALAGNVPLESQVPELVKKSQQEAGFAPEASANPEAIEEKTGMEKELESKVPEEPATSKGSNGNVGGMVAGGVAAGGLASAGAAYAYASTKTTSAAEPTSLPSRGIPASVQQSINESNFPGTSVASHGMPASVQQAINDMNKGSATAPAVPQGMDKGTGIAPAVPDVVQESIAKSHQSPEAAASKVMVGEKSAMESEFMSKVKTEDNLGEAAPSSGAGLTESAPAATTLATSTSATATSKAPDSTTAPVPSSTKPSASTPAPATSPTSAGSKTFHAPLSSTAEPAFTPATGSSMKQAIRTGSDSRDVSPMTRPVTTTTTTATEQQPQPTATTGIGSSAAPPTSSAPASSKIASSPNPSTGASTASGSTDKKSKRASGFFGKLKQKFGDKK